MKSAFDGIRVLELGHIYAGPYCGLLLAQLGADVIKLEPPGGERLRYRSLGTVETHEFLMLNSNKRSVVVDIKDGGGREVFLDLADSVDVIIENYAPGAMARFGLDPEDLMRRNPRLIYATGKGYGLDGPYAHMAAMDITVQAISGTISSTGMPDGPPVKAGPAFIDFGTGAHLFGGIAAALFQRERTGRGQLVDVAMHDIVYPTLASAFGGIYNEPDRELPERTGNRHSGLAIAPYNVYPAADGWVAIISVAERHVSGVFQAMGRPELAEDPRFADRFVRLRNIDAVDAEIEAWTRTLGRWDVVRACQEQGVPCAPVLTVREVAEDPHLRARGMIRDVEHPVKGTVPVPGNPIHLADSDEGAFRIAPPLGRDTDEVLSGLCGYPPERVGELRAAKAVE